jgi:hypothetical protein
MNFPPFWARGKSGAFSCWRWSFESLAEAQSLAAQAAQQLAERFGGGEMPSQHAGYYPDRPLREEVLQEIKDAAGATAAVVTRNSYGCLVLNTARVMFVDIDLPEQKPAGLFKRLFGGSGSAKQLTPEAAIARVENWTRGNPGWGWRIYRTRAGLRLLATHALMDADSPATDAVFEALGSDPLYRRLCKTQNCFRARLTPKPWRCGIHQKPPRWPWENAKIEKWFQKWDAQYQSFAAGWATCQFVSAAGNPAVHPEIAPVLKLHDEHTRVISNLKLA